MLTSIFIINMFINVLMTLAAILCTYYPLFMYKCMSMYMQNCISDTLCNIILLWTAGLDIYIVTCKSPFEYNSYTYILTLNKLVNKQKCMCM